MRFMALLLLGAASSAVAQDGLQQCRQIADGTQRLACYDALAIVAEPAPEAIFGKPPPPPKAPDNIDSRVVGSLRSWEKGTLFTLENQQVWKSVDDNSGYYPNAPDNPAVTIRKSWSGAYWMEVESLGRKIKVRRVK